MARARKRRDLRPAARKDVAEHWDRWDKLRDDGGEAVYDSVDDTFHYAERLLDKKTEPKDWVQEGAALLIGYASTGRKLVKALSKFYQD